MIFRKIETEKTRARARQQLVSTKEDRWNIPYFHQKSILILLFCELSVNINFNFNLIESQLVIKMLETLEIARSAGGV